MQHHCAPVNGQPKRRLSLRNRSRTDNISRRRQPAPVRCADTVPGPDGVLAGRGFGTEVGFRAASELCLPVSVPRSGNLSQFLLLCTALPLHCAVPVRWTFSPPKHPHHWRQVLVVECQAVPVPVPVPVPAPRARWVTGAGLGLINYYRSQAGVVRQVWQRPAVVQHQAGPAVGDWLVGVRASRNSKAQRGTSCWVRSRSGN